MFLKSLKKREREEKEGESETFTFFFLNKGFSFNNCPCQEMPPALQSRPVSSRSILSTYGEQLVTTLSVPTIHTLENQQWFALQSSLLHTG